MVLMDKLPIMFAVNVVHWTSFRIGSFREQFTIEHQDGTSFWIGAALNSNRTEWGRIRMDFNPNKVASHEAFQKLLSFLTIHSRPMHRSIRRYDLAVDIPLDRLDVILVKDQRAYIKRHHGRELTEYLGSKASTVGRVKLYNKSAEANLTYPLTRLELTLDPSIAYSMLPLPVVYCINTHQVEIGELNLNDTERFILNALLQGCGSLNQLCRKTREKMQLIMERYASLVSIMEHDYTAILLHLRSYIADTGTEQIDVSENDQPPKLLPPPTPTWVREAENAEEIMTDVPLQQ